MLISKFDLYNPEWLELVFRDRNKEYGAYYLRQHYADNMVRAMGIAFFGVAVLFGASVVFKSHVQPVTFKEVPVTLHPYFPPLPPVKRDMPLPPVKRTIDPPAPAVAASRDVPLVVTSDEHATDPIKASGPTSSTTTQGTPGGDNVLPVKPSDAGGGTAPAVDNSLHPPIGLDVMPEPVGGDAAWAKFLRKNLRFPSEAQDAGVGGRVILSFVIEKDGKLSNIVVDRAAGHGFDEEALRVLRLAKAWKPGIQNGQPVRVKYEIPINFQAIEQ